MAGREFWGRLQHEIDVLVGSRDAEQLLGVRDGFRRYFRLGAGPGPALSVRSGVGVESGAHLWTSAEATLEAAVRQADELWAVASGRASFCVAAEEGVVVIDVEGAPRSFVHTWAAVESAIGRACGGSGPVEIPERFTRSAEWAAEGGAAAGRPGVQVPGTRRRGGILGSLTSGLESRREAFADATFHALSSLFFGLAEARDARSGWNG